MQVNPLDTQGGRMAADVLSAPRWSFPFAIDFKLKDGRLNRSLRASSLTKKSSSNRTPAESNLVWLTIALIGMGGNSRSRRMTFRRHAAICSNTCHTGACARPPPSSAAATTASRVLARILTGTRTSVSVFGLSAAIEIGRGGAHDPKQRAQFPNDHVGILQYAAGWQAPRDRQLPCDRLVKN
jgi:hypothetical protein